MNLSDGAIYDISIQSAGICSCEDNIKREEYIAFSCCGARFHLPCFLKHLQAHKKSEVTWGNIHRCPYCLNQSAEKEIHLCNWYYNLQTQGYNFNSSLIDVNCERAMHIARTMSQAQFPRTKQANFRRQLANDLLGNEYLYMRDSLFEDWERRTILVTPHNDLTRDNAELHNNGTNVRDGNETRVNNSEYYLL